MEVSPERHIAIVGARGEEPQPEMPLHVEHLVAIEEQCFPLVRERAGPPGDPVAAAQQGFGQQPRAHSPAVFLNRQNLAVFQYPDDHSVFTRTTQLKDNLPRHKLHTRHL